MGARSALVITSSVSGSRNEKNPQKLHISQFSEAGRAKRGEGAERIPSFLIGKPLF